MKLIITYLLSVILLIQTPFCLSSPTTATQQQMLNGYIERVMLIPEHISLQAKLDTGADISSLNAQHIIINKDRHPAIVEFDLQDKSGIKHFSYPLLKIIGIKNRAGESANSTLSTERPMIEMKACLGTRIALIKVNLTDRSKFAYPFLLGREAMKKFAILIDPSRKYLNPLACNE